FLLLLTFGIIMLVGIYLVPPLAEIAGDNMVWTGMARSLIWLSEFSIQYWYIILGVFVALCVIIGISLPNWSGRLRAKFDKLPPWNVYKIQMSVGWLMSLSSMVAAGITIPDAMRMLADNSNKYLRDILEDTLHYIANGANLGAALNSTGRDFPNSEIIGDLAIYADMNGFDENLGRVANDYLEESVRKMESVSNVLNSIGILLVSAIIAWVVLGTFQMQDQITSALT
ncbi:MAG: type II secretion system F family protein, partial [Proteobacteria bacterium]|nr:type II secretion system F family protein [Candidatus Enterousia avistercoris]